ncbi:hypothetical protein V8V91_17830 [Algoriphagus halophilus]|uniref:DUF7507 domain-containing protein n=1 Tax=Algoriphagus halophilus TaxID=226505 RepID=UPI00358F8E44
MDQADIDAGQVINTATVVGQDNVGASYSDSDSKTVNAIQSPGIVVNKTADKSSVSTLGQIVTYTIEVENVGNVTLDDVQITDAKVGLAEVIPSFASGDIVSYTVAYTVTQDDLDGVQLENVVDVSATDTNGGIISDQDDVIISIVRQPGISLTKTADVSSVNAEGDIITYTLVLENTGNLTLENVTTVDPLTGLSALEPSLNPGQSISYTTSYTVTQTDIDTGFIENDATVTALTKLNLPIVDSDQVITPVNQNGGIDLIKTADKTTYSTEGEIITYTFTVENNGNLSLDPVNLIDPLFGLNEDLGILLPNATTTYTFPYTITQADVDRGNIRNVAEAIGFGPSGKKVRSFDQLIISANTSPSIELTKTANLSDFDQVGDIITYTLEVENTGNVTLSKVNLSDPLLGISQVLGTMTPNEIRTVTGTYTITQSDLDLGSLTNIAAVIGTTPKGKSTSDNASLRIDATQIPSILIEKSADRATVNSLNEDIIYLLKVTNTGNVTLTNVIITDPLTNVNQTLPSLAPGDFVEVNTDHLVSQAELDAGIISNTATATGVTPTNTTVTSSATVDVTVVQDATISLSKSANKTSFSVDGEEIEYFLEVSNTGNVTISSITLVDPKTGFNQNIGDLIPGAAVTVSSIYTVSLADINSGSIDNTATATGQDPIGNTVFDNDQLSISANQNPSIAFDKIANTQTFDQVGDILNYDLVVTNTGNVTLDNVTVTDPLTGTNQNLGSIDPGITRTISTSYAITQFDLDAGLVNNTAQVTSLDPLNQSIEATDSESITGQVIGEILVEKTSDLSSFSAVGDIINYTFTVTNTGNVTLYGVDVIDPILNYTSVIGVLTPGQVVNLTVPYSVSQVDIDSGEKINIVIAEGFDPFNTFVFDLDVLLIQANQNPSSI